MESTAKNAKAAKKIYFDCMADLAVLAYLAVQFDRCSKIRCFQRVYNFL